MLITIFKLLSLYVRQEFVVIRGCICFAFIAPVSNSISYVVIRTSPAKQTINNFALAAYGAFIGSVLVFIFAVCKYKTVVPMPMDAKYLVGWTYLAFGASGLITVCAYYLIEHIGPSKTTMMSLAHSPTALLLSVIFMNYELDAMTAIGMTCCVVALYFGLKYKQKVGERSSGIVKKRNV